MFPSPRPYFVAFMAGMLVVAAVRPDSGAAALVRAAEASVGVAPGEMGTGCEDDARASNAARESREPGVPERRT